jgi:hypothetical protein
VEKVDQEVCAITGAITGAVEVCQGALAGGNDLPGVLDLVLDRAIVASDLVAQLRQVRLLLGGKLSCLVPVRDLDADEHAGDHDRKLDDDGEPVPGPDRFSDAAQDHFTGSCSSIA